MSRSVVLSLVTTWCCLTAGSWTLAALPAERLLPASTKVFVSVPNTELLIESYNRTPLGRLINDPIMKPFLDDLRVQLDDKGYRLDDRIGVTLSELLHVATGEFVISGVATSQGKLVFQAIVDAGQNVNAAQQLLVKADTLLTKQRGGRRGGQQIGGTTIYVYDVPAGNDKPATHCALFIHDGLFCVGESFEQAQEILQRAQGTKQDSLATVSAYQITMKRCTAAMALPPHATWFIDPIGVVEAARATKPVKPKGTDLLKIAKQEGFDATKGIGGSLNLGVGQYGMLYRSFTYAPQPYQRAMRMLKFPNGGDFTPPAFLNKTMATYTAFNLDSLNAFDNFGTLFDAMFGEGESVWPDVIKSLEEDPDGPRINLRNDLVAHLENHGFIMIDNDEKRPVGPHTQRRLIALRAKNPELVAGAIQRLLKNDSSVKPRTINGLPAFEIIPEEPEADAIPALNVNNQNVVQAKTEPAPKAGVAVAHGHLLISSHIQLIEQILAAPQSPTPLATEKTFVDMQAELQRLMAGLELCAMAFQSNDEKYLATWEMFRQNRLPESTTPLAKLLNNMLNDAPEGGKRSRRFDGSKLPPYESIRQYGEMGSVGITSEADGWFLFGFTLDKHAPRAAEAVVRPRGDGLNTK